MSYSSDHRHHSYDSGSVIIIFITKVLIVSFVLCGLYAGWKNRNPTPPPVPTAHEIYQTDLVSYESPAYFCVTNIFSNAMNTCYEIDPNQCTVLNDTATVWHLVFTNGKHKTIYLTEYQDHSITNQKPTSLKDIIGDLESKPPPKK